MVYAWIIDADHTAGPDDEPGTNMNAVGIVGPRNVTPLMESALRGRRDVVAGWQVVTFKMHDDDGELYYTGRLLSDDVYENSAAPLDDYGTPNAGATSIRYPRHPELDV